MSEDGWLEAVGAMAYPDRAASMVLVAKLAKERNLQRYVETGCIRGWAGDGQSTLILAGLAIRVGTSCVSIDISEVHIAHAKEWVGALADTVRWVVGDSVVALAGPGLESPIDLLYLDSYDYNFDDPLPSQLHNLAEIGAAYGRLSDKAIVIVDDADLSGGGKPLFTAKFLVGRGWKVLHSAKQMVFSR